jgi:hypothetical protein
MQPKDFDSEQSKRVKNENSWIAAFESTSGYDFGERSCINVGANYAFTANIRPTVQFVVGRLPELCFRRIEKRILENKPIRDGN